MTSRLIISLVLLGTSCLIGQTPVIDVNFDNDLPQGLPSVNPLDASTPSDLWGGNLSNFSVMAVTGNRGMSEAAGLVTMIRVEPPDQPFSHEIVFSGDDLFPPVTAGIIEVSYDLIVEEHPVNQGYGYLRNFGAGFQSFADVVVYRMGNGFGIGPVFYNSSGEGFVDESTLAFFPIDVWFRITAVIDITQGTINVLIDGEDYGLTTTYGNFPASGYTGSLLSWEPGYIGLMCIDNFRVVLDDVAMGTLPVTWKSLSASWMDNCAAVEVSWETEQETEVSSYQVERFVAGGDWRAVGPPQQPGAERYATQDDGLNGEDLLYRVRQEDFDGTVRYSEAFSPARRSCPERPVLTVFPNPAGERLWLRGHGEAGYQITDALGRMVRSGTLVGGRAELDISDWKRGVYWLRTGAQLTPLLVR